MIKCCLKISMHSLMHLSSVNLPLFYVNDIFCICSSVHGFERTDLELNEGVALVVILMTLDVKGSTTLEPASTQVITFDFLFTCIDSSNGGGPQAVGELWM